MGFRHRIAMVLLFLASASVPVQAQQQQGDSANFIRRYFDNLLGDGGDPSAPKFINYPTLAFSPETDWEFGVSSLYVYSAKRDLTNRLSELKAFTFYTLENQYGVCHDDDDFRRVVRPSTVILGLFASPNGES